MQPTPLRGPKIAAFLKAGFSPTDFPIYHGGAADGQGVRSLIKEICLLTVRTFCGIFSHNIRDKIRLKIPSWNY